MSTLKTINLIHPTGSNNNVVLDSSGNIVSGTGTAQFVATTTGTQTSIFSGALVRAA
jgi:hypothetical protein